MKLVEISFSLTGKKFLTKGFTEIIFKQHNVKGSLKKIMKNVHFKPYSFSRFYVFCIFFFLSFWPCQPLLEEYSPIEFFENFSNPPILFQNFHHPLLFQPPNPTPPSHPTPRPYYSVVESRLKTIFKIPDVRKWLHKNFLTHIERYLRS